jgi:hypothetical protein
MLIRVLHIIDRIIAHNRVLILDAELYSSTTFRLVSKLVAFDREFVSKTNDVANRMQECVLQVFTLVSVRQGEVIAADVLDLVGEEGTSDHPLFAVVGAGLVVDKDEVGLARSVVRLMNTPKLMEFQSSAAAWKEFTAWSKSALLKKP